MSLFTSDLVQNANDVYLYYRKEKCNEDVRSFIDEIYNEIKDLVGDKDIHQRFQTEFHAFVWQFYLGYVLYKTGHRLVKTKENGPDYICIQGICFEATIATSGNGANKTFNIIDVGPIDEDGKLRATTRPYPDPKIILRITNSIHDKLKQYKKWRKDNSVTDSQPLVIAINTSTIYGSDDKSGFSYGARACFGLSAVKYFIPLKPFDKENNSQLKSEIIFTSHLKKENGEEILASIFLEEEYKEISAIIFSAQDIVRCMSNPGADIEVIFNPKALNPINRELFKSFKRVYVEIDEGKHGFILKTEDPCSL